MGNKCSNRVYYVWAIDVRYIFIDYIFANLHNFASFAYTTPLFVKEDGFVAKKCRISYSLTVET